MVKIEGHLCCILVLLACLFLAGSYADDKNTSVQPAQELFTIQGRVSLKPGDVATQNWQAKSRVLVDYGKYIGFIRYQYFSL